MRSFLWELGNINVTLSCKILEVVGTVDCDRKFIVFLEYYFT